MRACAASLLRHAGDALWDGGSCHRVLLTAGQSLAAARLTGPAVAWWREVAARCERLLGPGHPDTLVAAGQLADALLAAGQHADAVQLRAVGRGRPGPRARPRPPGCHRRQDQPRPGAGGLRRTRRGAPRSCGTPPRAASGPTATAARKPWPSWTSTPPRSSRPATPLPRCGSASGRWPAASRRTARPIPRPWPPRSAWPAPAWPDGKAKDAIGQYKRVLAAREQALGPDHPDTLAARASLAAAYDTAGRIGDALREHQQACAGCERALGPDHPLTLARRADLARAYYAAGQLGDALAVLRDSIRRAERALSPGDPVTRRLRQVQDGITADLAAE